MDATTISVRMLGGFSVRCGDRELASLPPQALSLLAYLIVHRSRPQTRDLLAGRFWSELPEDRARKRLSNTLWQIKSAAAEAGLPELLVTTPSTVRPVPELPFEVDAEDFEDQLSDFEREVRTSRMRGVVADRMAAVVESYPGDFLAGHYHDWIVPERDRIRERYHAALVELVALYKSRSQYDVALRFAHTLVGQEPLREDLHREVMRLHALLGQAAAAERQFDTCRQVFDAELGVAPSAETVELLERIRFDAPATPVRTRPQALESAAFVGRTKELSVLLGRADELMSGTGGVVLVEGDPGMGKTRLIEEFADGAEWRGLRVLRAGHSELSRMRPYEALRYVLAPSVAGIRGEHLAEVIEPVWLQQAAEVLPELARLVDGAEPARPLRPEEEPTRMSESLARVILAQGGLASTVIVLEDIHWCDDDSMRVLVQLGSRLARSGVLLCLTYRRFEAEQADSVWGGITKLEAMPSATRLVVGPLANADVRELVHSHLGPGGLPAGAINHLIEATDGNPLYILESVRNPAALLDEPDVIGGTIRTSLDLPSSVARSLEGRIAALDPSSRGVLEALAALAEPAAPRLVARIAGMERLPAVEALAMMADRGFVVDDDHGICRYHHDQQRRVVYELMSADRRRAVHARIFQALEEQVEAIGEDIDGPGRLEGPDGRIGGRVEAWSRDPIARPGATPVARGGSDDGGAMGDEGRRPEPAQLAHHARQADLVAEARHWHRIAAHRALALGGFHTAAEHFAEADEAAQDLGVDLAERARDLLSYEAALDVLGRRTEQTMLLKRLREVDLPVSVELELAEREVWLLINTDDPDEAARLAGRSVEVARASGEPVVGLLTARAVARYRAGDFNGVIGVAEQALEAATGVEERVSADTILGKALVDLMHYEEGEVHLARAAAAADSVGDDRGRIEAVSYLAVAHFRLGRLQEAERHLVQALELSRAIGYRWGEAANLGNLASLHTARGRGGQALEYFNEASDVFGSLDYGRGEAFIKHNSARLHHRLLGDDDTAAELASSAAVYFRSVGDQPNECLAMAMLSGVDRRRGKRRLARRRLNDLLDRAVENGDTQGEVETRRHLADLEFDADDPAAAAVHLDRILRIGEQYPLEGVLPSVLVRAAEAAAAAGERGRASSLADRVLATNMVGADQAHVTAWRCGTVLATLGRDDEAAEQYRLAHELLASSLRGLPAALVDRAWTSVPEHVAIAEDYERRLPIVATAEVPRIDAPTGRALTPNDLVDITWTVSEPADWDTASAGERRHRRLLRLSGEAEAQGGSARIADLAIALGVSERTVKRDLADIRAAGTTLRTRKNR